MRQSALALGLALLVLAGCGGSDSDTTASPARAQDVRAALEARLVARKLSYRWVVCVRTKRSFAASPIFRCNVNFGEPHIVRYCATLGDGRLVTSSEQPAMRCGREAG